MKKPAPKVIIVVLALLVIAGIGGFVFYSRQKKTAPVEVADDFPIWLLRDKEVAVYQEITVSEDKLEKTVVVSNLNGKPQENLKVYVSFSKEFAAKASDLTFNIQPEVIEEDPVVLWSVGDKDEGPGMLEFAGNILRATRTTIVGALTDICDTEDSLEWQKQNLWFIEPGGLAGCGKYIEHLETVVQERTREDWQNNLEDNEVIESVEPDDDQYESLRSNAKAVIQKEAPTPAPTPRQETVEEREDKRQKAVSKVRAEYDEVNALPVYDNIEAECTAVYNSPDRRWQIVCSRPGFSNYEFWYTFYVMDSDGGVRKVGNYTKSQSSDGEWKTHGAPRWGVR